MKRPWILITISFVLGELVGYEMSIKVIFIIVLMAILAVLMKKYSKFIILFSAFFILGMLCMFFAKNTFTNKNVKPSIKVERDIVVDEIVEKDTTIQIRAGKVIVYLKKELEVELKSGYKVRVTGKLMDIKPATNPGEFDAYLYYKAIGVEELISAKSIKVLDNRVNVFKVFLNNIRVSGLERLSIIYEKEEAAFLSAALFGAKNLIEDKDYNLYRDSGMAHLLAISGLHISILGMSVYFLLRKKAKFNFIVSGLLASILLLMYSGLVGGGVSVIRAVTMLITVFVAEYLGRSYDLLSAACFSAVIILIISPFQIFQISFLLSFLAVISISIGTYLVKYFKFNKKGIKYSILQSIVISITVQICTLPIISYFFFSFSIYSVILNIFVIPLMALVIWSAIGAVFISFFSFKLSIFISGLSVYILKLYRFLAQLSLSFPFAKVLTGRPSLIKILIYYLVLVLMGFLIKKNKKVFKRDIYKLCSLTFAYMLFIIMLLPITFTIKKTKITYLDIGQGDSIIVESGNENILIDSGSTTNKQAGRFILEPVAKSKAIKRFDKVFLTHADRDHTNAFLWLIENVKDIDINKVYLPTMAKGAKEYSYIVESLENANIDIEYIEAGFKFFTNAGSFECIWPYGGHEEITKEVNEQSITLLYNEKDFSALFTGDSGKVSEEVYVPENLEKLKNLTCLKVGHHGSFSATSKTLVLAATPKYAVISCAKNNTYGHPHREVLERLEVNNVDVFETDKNGAVILETDGKTLNIVGMLK